MRRVLTRQALICCLTLLSITSYAQTRPTVKKVDAIFETYPKALNYRQTLALHKKTSQDAQRIFEAGVQARIFRLPDTGDVPHAMSSSGKDCDWFISLVLSLPNGNGQLLNVMSLDESYLDLSYSGKSVKDGRYLVVFEKSGATEEIFRLHHDDAEEYFKAGITLVVQAGNASVASVKLAHQRLDEKRQILKLEKDNFHKYPCYRITQMAEMESDAMQLAHCAVGAK